MLPLSGLIKTEKFVLVAVPANELRVSTCALQIHKPVLESPRHMLREHLIHSVDGPDI